MRVFVGFVFSSLFPGVSRSNSSGNMAANSLRLEVSPYFCTWAASSIILLIVFLARLNQCSASASSLPSKHCRGDMESLASVFRLPYPLVSTIGFRRYYDTVIGPQASYHVERSD